MDSCNLLPLIGEVCNFFLFSKIFNRIGGGSFLIAEDYPFLFGDYFIELEDFLGDVFNCD
jgi:hypothetical protein